MKRIVAGALALVMTLTTALPAWADPGVRVYLRDTDAAAGAPLKEVPGDHVTIGDFRDLTVTIDGAAPASTSMQLLDGQARALGAKSAVGLKMDQPVGVAITGGGEHFAISNDACTGRLLSAPGEPGSSCFVDVRPSATWWGPFTGSLRMSSGSYSQDVPLAGRGRHFDLPNLTIALVSGTPAALNVTGQTVGDPRTSAPATFRITNTSTEETTDALVTAIGGSNPGNFEFSANACSGKTIAPGATCDVAVRAVSDRNASYAGTLTIASHNKPAVALAGAASGFLAVSWRSASWGACANACGASSQTRSVWCERSDGVVVADAFCKDARPAATQACTSYSSCTYAWRTTDWGSCANACGGSSQSRSVWCERSDGSSVDGGYCGWGGRPGDTQGCTSYSGCSYSWVAEGWGGCSASCGGGSQSRSVWCRRSDGASVDGGYCGWGGRPNDSQSCNTQSCCHPDAGKGCGWAPRSCWARQIWGPGCGGGDLCTNPPTSSVAYCNFDPGSYQTFFICQSNAGTIQCDGSCRPPPDYNYPCP